MPSKYVLHYWNIPGRAETIRATLSIAGVNFENKEYTFEERPKIAENETLFPMMSLPVLEINEEVATDSHAILRFVAAEHNLYGQSNQDRLIIDQILDTTKCILEKLHGAYFWAETAEEKNELLKKLFGNYVPRACKMYEKFLSKNNNNDYFAGNQISIGDIAFFNVSELIDSDFNLEEYKKYLDKYPLIKKNIVKITNHDKMKDYVKKRGSLVDAYRRVLPNK